MGKHYIITRLRVTAFKNERVLSLLRIATMARGALLKDTEMIVSFFVSLVVLVVMELRFHVIHKKRLRDL